MRILLVSPPHSEAAWLHKAFKESAHSLQRAEDSRDAVFLVTEEHFDAIVAVATESTAYQALLQALPKLAGAPNLPVVVAIVRGANAQERVKVLRAGADACFTQPYSFIEIQERIMALLRTASARPAEIPPQPAVVSLDAATRELVAGTSRLTLTKREYQLLECLLRQLGMPVPREQLIRYAWSDKEDVDPASVNLVVARLRRKLAQQFSHVRIETVSRYGYQLSAAP
ncbi:MAG TPA: response regulator transcription factor [Paraburkholderia sp.]|jgi:DNA-binding response OmpR family regulator